MARNGQRRPRGGRRQVNTAPCLRTKPPVSSVVEEADLAEHARGRADQRLADVAARVDGAVEQRRGRCPAPPRCEARIEPAGPPPTDHHVGVHARGSRRDRARRRLAASLLRDPHRREDRVARVEIRRCAEVARPARARSAPPGARSRAAASVTSTRSASCTASSMSMGHEQDGIFALALPDLRAGRRASSAGSGSRSAPNSSSM